MNAASGSRPLRFLGAALLLLLGVWAGLKVHSRRTAQHAGISVRAGQASAASPEDAMPEFAAPRPVIPVRLPDFSVNDLAGKPTPISAWRGKSLMINFWATWCAPCRSEIPLLETIATEWAARDLTVIGIAVDHPDNVQAFAEAFKINYPVLVGEQDALEAAAKFGMGSPAFPFTVFTDRRGEVVALFVGELHRRQVELILSQVQGLNQGKTLLPAARQVIAAGLD